MMENLRMYLWRRWMFISMGYYDRFGSHNFNDGSLQGASQKFFKLMITRIEPTIKLRTLLQQYYNTHSSWRVGPYLIMVDERCDDHQARWGR